MEDLCGLDPPVSSSSCLDDMLLRVGSAFPLGNHTGTSTNSEFYSSLVLGSSMLHDHHHHQQQHQQVPGRSSDLMKAQIATHPRYPNLISAYLECQKVGAPPEMASLLEEIGRENYTRTSCSEIGADPELDQFMESYCEILERYKEELSKPLDEAKTFLNDIESQLSNLCKGAVTRTLDYDRSDEADGTSDEEPSYGDVEAEAHDQSQASFGVPQCDGEVKGVLMRKYSGYLSNLKKEFLKTRKRGKLPKTARMTLMHWWNNHFRWPYPTEEEKMKLSEETGLNQKQINNWFINQRKRHWKPSEDMRFAILEGASVTTANNIEQPFYLENIGDETRIQHHT